MQMAEQVVSGVQAYCLCDWALHPVCWSMLAAGSMAKERKMRARPRQCSPWKSLLAMGIICIPFAFVHTVQSSPTTRRHAFMRDATAPHVQKSHHKTHRTSAVPSSFLCSASLSCASCIVWLTPGFDRLAMSHSSSSHAIAYKHRIKPNKINNQKFSKRADNLVCHTQPSNRLMVGGVAQRLGCRFLAGRLFLHCGRSMVDR